MGVVGGWRWKRGRIVDGPSQWSGCSKGTKGPYIPVSVHFRLIPSVAVGRGGLGAGRPGGEIHDWRICRLWKMASCDPQGAVRWVCVAAKDSWVGWLSCRAALWIGRSGGWGPKGPRACTLATRIAIATESEQSFDGMPAKGPRRCDVVPQCLNVNQSSPGAGSPAIIGPWLGYPSQFKAQELHPARSRTFGSSIDFCLRMRHLVVGKLG